MRITRKQQPSAAQEEALQDYKEGLADRLRVAREAQGIEQQDLATLVGLSRAMLSDFERNTRLPNLEHLLSLAKALHVQFAWLVSGEGMMLEEQSSIDLRRMAKGCQQYGIDFAAACLSVIRRIAPCKSSWEAGIRSTLEVYLGSGLEHGLNPDPRETAFMIEQIAVRFDLSLLDIFEGMEPSHAAEALLRCFDLQGIDGQAFRWSWENGKASGLHYHKDLARDKSILRQESEARPVFPIDPGLAAYVGLLLRDFRPGLKAS